MKLNYGKTSCYCFIAFWVFTLAWFFIDGKTRVYSRNNPFLEWICFGLPFFIPCLGIFFAVLGAMKKESPKLHCIVGFVLNFSLIALLCFLSYLVAWAENQS